MIKLPDNFIQWHRAYFFIDVGCAILDLPSSLPSEPLASIKMDLEWDELISFGFIPFGHEGNDTGPLIFDTRNSKTNVDFPIRVYEHEYCGDPEGVSEIIFSSFEKLLECVTHFVNSRSHKKDHEIIPDFLKIDPEGAGKNGNAYWNSWHEMLKANFEEFGY